MGILVTAAERIELNLRPKVWIRESWISDNGCMVSFVVGVGAWYHDGKQFHLITLGNATAIICGPGSWERMPSYCYPPTWEDAVSHPYYHDNI